MDSLCYSVPIRSGSTSITAKPGLPKEEPVEESFPQITYHLGFGVLLRTKETSMENSLLPHKCPVACKEYYCCAIRAASTQSEIESPCLYVPSGKLFRLGFLRGREHLLAWLKKELFLSQKDIKL